MEPLSTLHNLVEIEIRWICLSDRTMSTVIDYLRRTHRSTCLCIIETNTVATTSNEIGIHAITTEGVNCNLTNLMLRQLRYEVSLMTIVSYTDCYVSLTTTRDDTE